MTTKKVVLLACGSFNPPTNMHLRMFEIARDHLNKLGVDVILGLVSPVHDGYGKKDLASSTHRLAMLTLALQDSNWIKITNWECTQEGHTRTAIVLKYIQNKINDLMNNRLNDNFNEQDISWFPNNLQTSNKNINVQVKLLCGADLLESFGVPGLWSAEDIEFIVGHHGLVVITREDSNPLKFIYMSDVLTKYMSNIAIVTEWITNDVSSTKVRRALRRHESVKYLIPDKVIEYIKRNELFGWIENNKYLLPPVSTQSNYLLTPSPVDISMDSPSPTSLNCMSICNNNLFSGNQSHPESYPPIDSVDHLNKNNVLNSFKHPGQAVKIITDSLGEHTVVKCREDSDNEAKLDRPACLL